jgi:cytochrome c-type biogenesis protein CcmH/NrfF
VRLGLVLLAALAIGVPAALASEEHPTLQELEGQVMCPACEVPLDQSSSPAANRIRIFIAKRIRAGDTRSEIMDKLVEQFGPEIRAAPATSGFGLLAWVLPLVALLGGGAVVGVYAWRWSRSREPVPSGGSPHQNGRAPLDPELERKLEDELARFE